MNEISFFTSTHSVAQKQYEALRLYFVEGAAAKVVAEKFGYTYRGFTTIISDFRKKLKDDDIENLFFSNSRKGRPVTEPINTAHQLIIELRKKYYSVADIKINLDSCGHKISEKTIYNVLYNNGFSKLPRRLKTTKQKLEIPKIEAPISSMLKFENQTFKSGAAHARQANF